MQKKIFNLVFRSFISDFTVQNRFEMSRSNMIKRASKTSFHFQLMQSTFLISPQVAFLSESMDLVVSIYKYLYLIL